MKHTKAAFSLLKTGLCVVLIAALALSLTACNTIFTLHRQESANTPFTTVTVADGETVGTGATAFPLEITDGDGHTVAVTVKTDEDTVGEALQALGIIAGEEGAYGLYVKEVNGITADYDKDGAYWAFYVDGDYATAGVDKTPIEAGKVYQLKVEKG